MASERGQWSVERERGRCELMLCRFASSSSSREQTLPHPALTDPTAFSRGFAVENAKNVNLTCPTSFVAEKRRETMSDFEVVLERGEFLCQKRGEGRTGHVFVHGASGEEGRKGERIKGAC